MELEEMVERWKMYDKKLEESLSFNRKNAEDITRMKVQSFLSSMKPRKIFTIVVGILWVALLDFIIIALYPVAGPFFMVSTIIISLLNKLAIGIYLYQLVLIHQVDISEPILAAQERLSRLRSSTLWVARILILQLPMWGLFSWGKAFPVFTVVIVTLFLACVAIWFFFNIKYENRHKWWFRNIFRGKEWEPLIRSMYLLEQIGEYKDSPPNSH